MSERIVIDIPVGETAAWNLRIAEITREIDALDKRRNLLQVEKNCLQRKVMAVDFLTDSTKLRDSAREAINMSFGVGSVHETLVAKAEPGNPNVSTQK